MNITNNSRIRLVNLPKTNKTYDFASDNGTSIASIAGWGRTENGTMSKHLLYANLSIVDVEQCKQKNRKLGFMITSQQLCAIQTDNATRPTDACKGDSGGPLIQYYNKYQDYVQTGIISFGDGCATPGIPGAYARVDQFIDWIDEVINKDNKQDEVEAKSAKLLYKSNVDLRRKTSAPQNEKLIDGTTGEGFLNVTEKTPIIKAKKVYRPRKEGEVVGGDVPEENTWKFMVIKVYVNFS